MNVPDDLKYAETHEWVRVDGDTGTVGITRLGATGSSIRALLL